ncbi:MAG TPA: DUF1697 domain-containing protein [Gaiellaceae bacterium]|jgi:uncharacterized protein (DUF1697 family)|nr:DUF1697 domain-containing protein [Gaiellaceae bacterium]
MAGTRTYAALLRGINVGGHAKIPMRELSELFGSLGHTEVATYIQSGNVVFRSELGKPRELVRAIEGAIAERYGLAVTVILRTPAELASIAASNPFPDDEQEPSKLHVLFLDRAPAATAASGLDPERSPGDSFSVTGREIYLRFPGGSGKTRLTLDWFERQLGVKGTARNWNTLLKLISLSEPSAAG